MKNVMALVLCLGLLGCATSNDRFNSYIDEPRTILKDQNFTNLEDELNTLESAYLNKEVSYAEYLQRKEELNAMYDRQSQKNQAIIDGNY